MSAAQTDTAAAVDYAKPENARFDRDLETSQAKAVETERWLRESGLAPDVKKVRLDNPRHRHGAGGRRKQLTGTGKRGRAKSLPGVYLGVYSDSQKRQWHLRADGVQPRGVLIMGPPGTGKSACYFIPTLLATAGTDKFGRGMSAFVYDPKGELYALTAGYRKAMGHKVLLFAPAAANALSVSCHINIFDSIRWSTSHEIADVQNIVKLILDPKDKAAEGAEAHWIVTGSVLLECVILWLHYNDPANCSLKGCYDYLTNPDWIELAKSEDPKKQATAVDEALKHMLKVPHAATGSITDALTNGWVDSRGNPSPYHPYVVHSAVEIQGKAPNEKSGVVSTTTRFLHPFRDEILAELTGRSDFAFDDLMNHESPVSLYFVIPPSDIQRLRVIVSLFLQLLVRAHTGDNALEYRGGVPYYRYRHRLLLAVDEFPQLGKQEQFILALSIMRSYGLWPMLGVQSPNQIFDSLGKYQTMTSMMYYKVFLKPNDSESAEWISSNLGDTTKKKEEVTYSGGRLGFLGQRSVRVSYERGKLLAADTLMSMPSSSGIVCGGSADPKQWDNPIWVNTLFWEHNAELRRRSGNAKLGGKFPAPEATDYIIHHPSKIARNHAADLSSAAAASASQAPTRESVEELKASLTGGASVPSTAAVSRSAEIVAAAQQLLDERAVVPTGAIVIDNPDGATAAIAAAAVVDADSEPVEPAEHDSPAAESLAAAVDVAPITPAMREFLALGGGSEADLGAPASDGFEDDGVVDEDTAVDDDAALYEPLDDGVDVE